MIVVDFSQVSIADLMASWKEIATSPDGFTKEIYMHIILNSIKSFKKKYRNKYGQIVIACDSRHYWRKDIFPWYKANRKKNREKIPVDWDLVFRFMNEIKTDIKENFPYPVLEVYGAEADDIIGVLCEEYGNQEDIMIISGDKDFRQLQRYQKVHQYAPAQKKALIETAPLRYLKEHTIRGDRGDGIPNVLSANDVFVTGTRQTVLSQKRFDAVWNASVLEMDEDVRKRFIMNEELVDLSRTPLNIKQEILTQFDEPVLGSMNKMRKYFMFNGMSKHMENIGDF